MEPRVDQTPRIVCFQKEQSCDVTENWVYSLPGFQSSLALMDQSKLGIQRYGPLLTNHIAESALPVQGRAWHVTSFSATGIMRHDVSKHWIHASWHVKALDSEPLESCVMMCVKALDLFSLCDNLSKADNPVAFTCVCPHWMAHWEHKPMYNTGHVASLPQTLKPGPVCLQIITLRGRREREFFVCVLLFLHFVFCFVLNPCCGLWL